MPVLDTFIQEANHSAEIREKSAVSIAQMNTFMDQNLSETHQAALVPPVSHDKTIQTTPDNRITMMKLVWESASGIKSVFFFSEKGKPGNPCVSFSVLRTIGNTIYRFWAAENEYNEPKSNGIIVSLRDRNMTQLIIHLTGSEESVKLMGNSMSESQKAIQDIVPGFEASRLYSDKSYQAEIVEIVKNKLFS